MTTTLRPAGPEEPSGGGRSRRWLICVNGRPVGGLRTTATRYGDDCCGEISELVVDDGRRRGRGTVGVLAAEEVLRGWGCTRVDVRIPAEAHAALRLAEALGYTERMRNLEKRLDQPPPLPPELTVRRIGEDEFADWLSEAKAAYIDSLLASGLSEQQARTKVDADHVHVLAQGSQTPGVALRRLLGPDGTVLGSLWVQLRQDVLPDGRPLAWVMTVEVAPALRGRGHGRSLMMLAEHECVAAGVHDLGLNVFSDNAPAISLYESLGYRVTRHFLGHPL